MIQSPYELTGNWTTVEEGETFLATIATETGWALDSIGKSFRGRELTRLTIGTGSKKVMMSAGVHGSEPASREAVLIRMRDMAYNADEQYTDYLNEYAIMFIPTVNPDRMLIGRNNSQELNINRDAYSLETPEMVALMQAISSVSPELYVDFHERMGVSERLEFIRTTVLDPNAESSIKTINQSMVEYVMNSLNTMGYSTAYYPNSIISAGMTISAANMMGVAAMTPETYFDLTDKNFRVLALSRTFDKIIDWHKLNKQELTNAAASFLENPLKPYDEFTLLNGDSDYYTTATELKIAVPVGYQLENPTDFLKWQEAYSIEVDESGFVPINQKTSRLLPRLLDPQSDVKAAVATRIEPDYPPPNLKRTDGRYTRIRGADGWDEIFIKNYLYRAYEQTAGNG